MSLVVYTLPLEMPNRNLNVGQAPLSRMLPINGYQNFSSALLYAMLRGYSPTELDPMDTTNLRAVSLRHTSPSDNRVVPITCRMNAPFRMIHRERTAILELKKLRYHIMGGSVKQPMIFCTSPDVSLGHDKSQHIRYLRTCQRWSECLPNDGEPAESWRKLSFAR